MRRGGTLTLLFAAAIWLAPAGASAEDPATAPLPRTATELVDQVMLVVDAIEAEKRAETDDEGASAQDQEGEPDPDKARARRARDRGIVPYARTIYELAVGDFPLADVEQRSEREAGKGHVLLQFKPKSIGGYFRCKFRF
jgi:hypothetical protein